MKISKRLKTICDFVCDNSSVIDVGADHALTDIYLTKYKNCKCLATDISANALEKAKENIKKYNVNVELKVNDGLKNIKLKDEIIIISGMGTHTIMDILNLKINNDIIISSHNDIPLLKKIMMKKGYFIHRETVVFEKHFYVITYYKYGKGKKTDFIISPFLKDNKEYMQFLYNKYLLKYQNTKNIFQKFKLKRILNKISNNL